MAGERGINTAPILALVAAEIGVLMLFVGVCEARARTFEVCDQRWALVLPAVALAGQSAATYFMDSGRGGSANRQPRNALGQFSSPRRRPEDEHSV